MALTSEYFLSRVMPEPNTGCWLWTGNHNPKGYGVMSNGHTGRYPAHRFAYELFVEPVKSWDGFDCCHRCDTPSCVNPSHLFKGTRSQNMKDAGAKGRHWTQTNPKKAALNVLRAGLASRDKIDGSKNINAKFNLESIGHILALLEKGMNCQEIANIVGGSRWVIGSIKRGQKYKNEIRALKEPKP